ncbi:hypothetical protein MKX01_028500 [Papaver californicum]|nr:hypothetical protein MKX01_028500 [Papaver californicum]
MLLSNLQNTGFELLVPATLICSFLHCEKRWETMLVKQHVLLLLRIQRQEEQERRIRTTAENMQVCRIGGNSFCCCSSIQKAMEIHKAHVYHEEQISKQDVSETEQLKNYMMYLKFELSSGDPSRVQILYERAVTDFPLSSDLWLDYTCHLEQTLKVPEIVTCAYSRAARNCHHASELELATVYEQSLLCSFSSFEEYLNLFLTRIHFRPKEHKWSVAYVCLLGSFGVRAGKRSTAARGVWESLLKISGSMLEAWEAKGSWEPVQKIIQDICLSSLSFEREFGTPDDYDHVVKKVTPRLEELQLFKQQQEARLVAESVPRGDDNPGKKPSQKRKTGTRQTDEQPTPKRQVVQRLVYSIFISNLHLQASYPISRVWISLLDFTNAENLSKALAKNKKILLGKKELGDKRTRTTATESGTMEDPKISTEHSKESGAPLPASAIAVEGDLPRNLARPLGWTKSVTGKEEENDEIPKSNDEFRKMLLKKR